MKSYELRYLDRLGVAILTRIFNSNDDRGALAEAERQCLTHTIEVWDGHRMVARVKKGNATIVMEVRMRINSSSLIGSDKD